MNKLFNVYSYTRTGERVIVCLDMDFESAKIRARYEVAFIESMGDKLQRFDLTWFGDGYKPRVGIIDTKHDPFIGNNKRVHHLPDIADL